MPTLSLVNFNIVCATLGGFITAFGLVSYLLKEKFYLSEALISTLAGLIFSPHATNFLRPLDYANDDQENLETITLYFTRLVLGVQLVLAGVQLPSKYLWTERKSLAILLGPGMCAMWVVTSLLVWGLVPKTDFVMALAIGACVTPTDPILSNSIVKGKFADKNIPPSMQKIIIAESGANDGLGYPFLFLGLYLLRYLGNGGLGQSGGARQAFILWFGDTWAYTIIVSIVYGAVVGWIAKELLHYAEKRHFVDRESFLVFAVTLALFIVGTVGMIGSDDVLACFIAGNVFTWDDWFRLETKDDSLQPTIDMLLNVAVFMWLGAVCPWHQFAHNEFIPIYRLIPLGMLVLLLRRLPFILAFRKQIHQVEELRHAAFMGWFGPIGVSAIFYLYISREYLRQISYLEAEREDAHHLAEVMNIVVWFLVVCSIVCHGLSVPLAKLGFYLPRTISTAISPERPSRSPSASRARTEWPDFHANDRAQAEKSHTSVYGRCAATIAGTLRSKKRAIDSTASQIDGRKIGNDDILDGEGSRPEISRPISMQLLGSPFISDAAALNIAMPEHASTISNSEPAKAAEVDRGVPGSPTAAPSGTVTPEDNSIPRRMSNSRESEHRMYSSEHQLHSLSRTDSLQKAPPRCRSQRKQSNML